MKVGHALSVEKWYESTEPMVKLNDMNQRPKIQGRVFAILGKVMRKLSQVPSPYFSLIK